MGNEQQRYSRLSQEGDQENTKESCDLKDQIQLSGPDTQMICSYLCREKDDYIGLVLYPGSEHKFYLAKQKICVRRNHDSSASAIYFAFDATMRVLKVDRDYMYPHYNPTDTFSKFYHKPDDCNKAFLNLKKVFSGSTDINEVDCTCEVFTLAHGRALQNEIVNLPLTIDMIEQYVTESRNR